MIVGLQIGCYHAILPVQGEYDPELHLHQQEVPSADGTPSCRGMPCTSLLGLPQQLGGVPLWLGDL